MGLRFEESVITVSPEDEKPEFREGLRSVHDTPPKNSGEARIRQLPIRSRGDVRFRAYICSYQVPESGDPNVQLPYAQKIVEKAIEIYGNKEAAREAIVDVFPLVKQIPLDEPGLVGIICDDSRFPFLSALAMAIKENLS